MLLVRLRETRLYNDDNPGGIEERLEKRSRWEREGKYGTGLVGRNVRPLSDSDRCFREARLYPGRGIVLPGVGVGGELSSFSASGTELGKLVLQNEVCLDGPEERCLLLLRVVSACLDCHQL